MSVHPAQLRGSDGRFLGLRVNSESIPTLPASLARMALSTPTKPMICLWTVPGAPDRVEYLATIEVAPEIPSAVRVAAMGLQPTVIRLAGLRRRRGAAPAWRCPRCSRLTPFLFTAGVPEQTFELGLGCSICLRLGYMSRGGPRTPKVITRRLLGLHNGESLPRSICVPTLVTSDLRRLTQFRNLAIQEAQHEPGAVARSGVMP